MKIVDLLQESESDRFYEIYFGRGAWSAEETGVNWSELLVQVQEDDELDYGKLTVAGVQIEAILADESWIVKVPASSIIDELVLEEPEAKAAFSSLEEDLASKVEVPLDSFNSERDEAMYRHWYILTQNEEERIASDRRVIAQHKANIKGPQAGNVGWIQWAQGEIKAAEERIKDAPNVTALAREQLKQMQN